MPPYRGRIWCNTDDQHSCAGSTGSQPVFHGGSGAQIHKDLGVAEKE